MKLFLALLAVCYAAIPGDKIAGLPYCHGECTAGDQYSGYIKIKPEGHNFHYILSVSEGDPKTDPVVLWMNGGPGCSSMDGYFYEQGPIHFATDDPRTIYNNPWRWNKMATMIFLEAPVGVGFSYSDNGQTATNDNKTADDNHRFVQELFKAFPEYSTQDLYISGESYAGIYVPMLSYRVANDPVLGARFKGMMVGNGVTLETEENFVLQGFIPFLYGHAIIDETEYNKVMTVCQDIRSTACKIAVGEAQSQFQGYDVYNVYGNCFSQRPTPPFFKKFFPNYTQPIGVVPPCVDASAATSYLNDKTVKEALHVNTSITWAICSQINYNSNEMTMIPIYKFMISKGYKVLVYSGDTDAAVPYTGTWAWLKTLGLRVRKGKQWEAWTFKNSVGEQVGGRLTQWQGLTYATVRGSGHMVPQYRPEAAYNMFQRFVDGEWWN